MEKAALHVMSSGKRFTTKVELCLSYGVTNLSSSLMKLTETAESCQLTVLQVIVRSAAVVQTPCGQKPGVGSTTSGRARLKPSPGHILTSAFADPSCAFRSIFARPCSGERTFGLCFSLY